MILFLTSCSCGHTFLLFLAVVLTSTVTFYGFMMDGRRIDGGFGGFFVSLGEPDYNLLLDCEGNPVSYHSGYSSGTSIAVI